MRIPSIQTLRSFDAACRHQSYSRAGQELGLTHSAISHRIRELETLLGKTLFDRKGNRMVPNADGRHLHAQVANALSLLANIFEQEPETGKVLTLSVFPALSRWLIPRLSQWRSNHPEIELRLHQSSVPEALGEGIDAAIRYGSGQWAGAESRRLANEIFIPVCSPRWRAEFGDRAAGLDPTHLLRHPWHSWEAWFQQAGIHSPGQAKGPEYSDSAQLIDAALAGEGVALARGMGVVDRLSEGSLVRLFDTALPDERAYYFVRPSGPSLPALADFERWLANEFDRSSQLLES